MIAALLVGGVLVLLPQLRPADVDRLDVLILGVGILAASRSRTALRDDARYVAVPADGGPADLFAWAYAAALAVTWAFWELTVTRAAVIWTRPKIFGA